MDAKAIRKPTAFRLNEKLVSRLKEEARKANRSLNNYVECILMDSIYNEPNEDTLATMKEVESGAELETLDLDDFEKYVASL
jgi:hypothetical protein